MHSPKMLMNKRTMILHSFSTEVQIAAKFYKFLPKYEKFLLSITYFLDSLLILKEGFFHEVFPIFLILLSHLFFIYIACVTFGLVSSA